MKISLWDIYKEFFFLGVQLLGGGFVIYPLILKTLAENKNWITKDELTDFFALSQSIPGIVAVNTSIFVGYKLRGALGAVLSVVGIITSPVIVITILAVCLDISSNLSFLQGVFWGTGIAVIILVYLSVKEMWKDCIVDWITVIIFLLSFLASFVFNISPVYIIIAAIITGSCLKFITERNRIC